MSNLTGLYLRLTVDTTAKRVVSQVGAVLLVATSARIMNPVTTGKYQYPNGYAVYMNESGQTVNPPSGQTNGNSDPFAHIGLP